MVLSVDENTQRLALAPPQDTNSSVDPGSALMPDDDARTQARTWGGHACMHVARVSDNGTGRTPPSWTLGEQLAGFTVRCMHAMHARMNE